MNLKERAKRLRADIPALLIGLKSRETPVAAKILAGITIAYALSPIDLIPDFIPVLGYLDDIILLPGLIALTIRFSGNDAAEWRAEEVVLRDSGRACLAAHHLDCDKGSLVLMRDAEAKTNLDSDRFADSLLRTI
jgi:uncharacterized membrane protein YkvA (DUF1232 family)